ncbi:MAG: hypothetical protein AAB451_00950 [Patescibacteria group bacterium]
MSKSPCYTMGINKRKRGGQVMPLEIEITRGVRADEENGFLPNYVRISINPKRRVPFTIEYFNSLVRTAFSLAGEKSFYVLRYAAPDGIMVVLPKDKEDEFIGRVKENYPYPIKIISKEA